MKNCLLNLCSIPQLAAPLQAVCQRSVVPRVNRDFNCLIRGATHEASLMTQLQGSTRQPVVNALWQDLYNHGRLGRFAKDVLTLGVSCDLHPTLDASEGNPAAYLS